ncbi:unnamed protein product, partial [Darwinula stevensoni]
MAIFLQGNKSSMASLVMNVLGPFLLLWGVSNAWLNDWDKPFNFACPWGQAISRIISEHHNRHEDRRYEIFCRPAETWIDTCEWTSYVNDFRSSFYKLCPNDVIMKINMRIEDSTSYVAEEIKIAGKVVIGLAGVPMTAELTSAYRLTTSLEASIAYIVHTTEIGYSISSSAGWSAAGAERYILENLETPDE